MKISVITVCYNAAKTIRGTMESVWEQSPNHRITESPNGSTEIEYIVVDGGSTDGTVEEIKNFELRVKGEGAGAGFSFKWLSEKDKGMYDAINKGVRMSTGDVIGILNADDRFEDDHVLVDLAAGFTDDVECVYGDVRFVRREQGTGSREQGAGNREQGTGSREQGAGNREQGAGSGDWKTVRYYNSKPWRPWMHNWGYMPAHPTVYVRRSVFETFGDYKLGYDISADFEWMVRILCHGKIRAKYLPRCMVTMRLGGKSTAGLKAMLRLNRENVRANRENGYFCCLPMMLPKYFFKVIGYFKTKGRSR